MTLMSSNNDSELVSAARVTAGRLGISPSDLLTAISYETGGRMSPSLWGGSKNKYLGLIQFGPEEQKKYGVTSDQSAVDQMESVENYLRDRGVKPGMGLLDVYSAINAGRPGLYDRSDAANGGAPGTVAEKVASMYGHRQRANALLGGDYSVTAAPVTPASSSGSPPSMLQVMPEAGANEGAGAPDIAQAISSRTPQAPPPPQIDLPLPSGFPAAQRLAMIMQKLQQAQVQNGS